MKSLLDKRIESMTQGAQELQLWILDALRQGLGHLQSQPIAVWDSIAARMTDAKLGAISRRLRLLRDRRNDAQWPVLFFNELADLYLFTCAWGQLDTLPAPLQEELLVQGGRTYRKAELLQQQPPLHDNWLALAQRTGVEEDLRWRRTWFWAEKHQRPAMVLDFSFRDAPYEQEWLIGAVYAADFYFFPGIAAQRAVVGEFVFSAEPYAGLEGIQQAQALAHQYAAQVAAHPFLSIFPVVLLNFSIILQDQRFFALDQEGYALPLSDQADKNWKLLAVSAGQAISFFAEWDGQVLHPLALVGTQRIIKL